MEPDIVQSPQTQGQAPEPSVQLLTSPSSVGKSLQGAVHGGLSTLYLHLLSLRMGLLGWYFCLKQMQWDFFRWVHASVELATDLVFCWAQNVLLAFMMLLILAWRVREGVKAPAWDSQMRRMALTLELAWAPLFLLRRAFWRLKHLALWIAWAPACCLAWMICLVARTLEISYKQAAKMAQEEEEEEGKEEEKKALLTLIMRQEKKL